jgi:zinc/manganese transport system substrate-binding protein
MVLRRHGLGTRLAVAVTLVLAAGTACSSAGAHDGRLQVVASTDVYGDLIRSVAGSHADVTAFIDDPSQDPHSYQAVARDQLALSRADVIVENGAGYDDFMDRMRSASATKQATTIQVAALAGRPITASFNEHVWYDFATVERFVARVVAVLSARRPAAAASFRSNAARLDAGLRDLQRTERTLRAHFGGTPVAITEPVPGYLLDACGLVDRTPEQFSTSIEDGTDASASVLRQTLALFDDHAVRVLVYNDQTAGAETTRVLAVARADGVPAVPMTETLPSGATYLSWMRGNLRHLATALSAAARQ